MGLRKMCWFVAACGTMIVPLAAVAAPGTADAFAAMRVDRIVPPRPAANVVLRATDGTALRLADFKGKVVVVGFLMTN